MSKFLRGTKVGRARVILLTLRDMATEALAFGVLLMRKLRLAPQASGRHLLFIDDLVPDPTFGAGYPRAFEMVRELVADGWQVTVYPLAGGKKQARKVAEALPSVRFMRGKGARGLRRLLITRGTDFAALIVSRPQPMAAYIAAARGRHFAPVIYDAEALLASREGLRRSMQGNPWALNEQENAIASEIALAKPARAIMAVTPAEAALFRSHLDVPVVVASHCLTAPFSGAPFDRRQDLLFVGRLTGDSSTSPNVDSIAWFVREVMPLLDQLIDERFCLHLVGMLESTEITDLLSDRVIAHGVVDDLVPFFDSAKVFIAPTRFSAGLPLKVVESMTRGLPSATTPILKYQLGDMAQAGIEPSATQFAQEVSRLYRDPSAWQRARDSGQKQVETHFSPEAFREAIRDALRAAGVRR